MTILKVFFQARHNGKPPGRKNQKKKSYKWMAVKNGQEFQLNLKQGEIFLFALHAKGQITCLKIVVIRGSLKFNVTTATSGDTQRGIVVLSRINFTHKLHIKLTSLMNNLKLEKTCLWILKHVFQVQKMYGMLIVGAQTTWQGTQVSSPVQKRLLKQKSSLEMEKLLKLKEEILFLSHY